MVHGLRKSALGCEVWQRPGTDLCGYRMKCVGHNGARGNCLGLLSRDSRLGAGLYGMTQLEGWLGQTTWRRKGRTASGMERQGLQYRFNG